MSTSHLLPPLARLNIPKDVASDLLDGHKPHPDAVHEQEPFPPNTFTYDARGLPMGIVIGKSEKGSSLVIVIVAKAAEMVCALDPWSLVRVPQYNTFVDRRDGKVMAVSLEVGRGVVFNNDAGGWMVARVLEFSIWGEYDDPVSKGRWERWASLYDLRRINMPIFGDLDGR